MIKIITGIMIVLGGGVLPQEVPMPVVEVSPPTKVVVETEQSHPVMVKLSTPEVMEHRIYVPTSATILGNNGSDRQQVLGKSTIVVSNTGAELVVKVNGQTLTSTEFKITPNDALQPLEIASWNRRPSWDTKGLYNDNVFLGGLHLYAEPNTILVVNELSLEDYMRGVAEVPEGDEPEKRKALAVIARSYVAHYIYTSYKKFDDPRYNASDSPAIFQKYLGYGFHSRSPKWGETLAATKGIVLTHNDQLLRAAYSSCTDMGGVRNTPQDIGWSDTYFNSTKTVYANVPDPLGIDPIRAEKNQCGHGVGLSGLGATNLAKEGKTYREILEYYYANIAYKTLY